MWLVFFSLFFAFARFQKEDTGEKKENKEFLERYWWQRDNGNINESIFRNLIDAPLSTTGSSADTWRCPAVRPRVCFEKRESKVQYHLHRFIMCGIVGYVGEKEAYPIIIKGLNRLEYRGRLAHAWHPSSHTIDDARDRSSWTRPVESDPSSLDLATQTACHGDRLP